MAEDERAARPLNILFVAAEAAPLVSTGGLADVINALPKALHARGHDVRIVVPCFHSIPGEFWGEPHCLVAANLGHKREHGQMRRTVLPETDIPVYLIEHHHYFGREKPYGIGAYEYEDNPERFSFFCLAALHGVSQLDWKPDLVHCHDWHASAIPGFLKTQLASDPYWGGMPAVFSIHNLAFQGRYAARHFSSTGFGPEMFSPDLLEFHGDMSLIKAAIIFSEKLSTVSPRYAQEIQTLEYGAGLDGVLRTRSRDLRGILNGVDYAIWNPATDRHLPANFSVDAPAGKRACKRELQEKMGLPKSDAPLFGVVSRLYWQKGIDLVAQAMEDLVQQEAQFVFLGTGDPEIERALDAVAQRYPDKVRVSLGFDVPLSHLIYAGSDFFLMPSRYEPCGLSQMYSLAYGTVPIVRRTGGLADSVRDLDIVHRHRGDATGFSFVPLTRQALVRAVFRAIELYRRPEDYRTVQDCGMNEDFSWSRSCRAYEQLYDEAIAAAEAARAA